MLHEIMVIYLTNRQNSTCWLPEVLSLPVSGSAKNSLSSTVIIFMKHFYLEVLKTCIFNFFYTKSYDWTVSKRN